MDKAILAINAGSSSIKFALHRVCDDLGQALIYKGVLDKHASSTNFVIHDAAGKTVNEEGSGPAGADDLATSLLARLEALARDIELAAVGHRVVHGGPRFFDPVIVSEQILKALDNVSALAPLHQPACLSPIRSLMKERPKLAQIACFDTAFHRNLDRVHQQFPIPIDPDLHRYGFHGLSFEYIAHCLDRPELKTVIAHLGSGSSLCALTGGKSVNTTMSLTPLDGLVMATRCGAVDPGLLLYLQKSRRMPVDELEDILYHKSGLLALSGFSSDMRELLKSREAQARLAVAQFCARAAEHIAVMATSLRGFDRLVFTGGIGEHSAQVRTQISQNLSWMGLTLDEAANIKNQRTISSPHSGIVVEVMPTNEELMIIKHTAALTGFAK